VAIGVAVGMALDNLALGIGLGIAIAFGLSQLIDYRNSKKDKPQDPQP
jgi:hypothetical protein